jgi:hypothetical protein
MTVARVMMAAFCALAAGVAVENAKATQACGAGGASASSCLTQPDLGAMR